MTSSHDPSNTDAGDVAVQQRKVQREQDAKDRAAPAPSPRARSRCRPATAPSRRTRCPRSI